MESDISRTHRSSRTQLSTRDVPDHDPQIRRLQITRLQAPVQAPGEAPNSRAIVDEEDEAWCGCHPKIIKNDMVSTLEKGMSNWCVFSERRENYAWAAADGANVS